MQGAPLRSRWLLAVAAHSTALLAGSAVTGGLLAALARATGPLPAPAVGAVALLAAAAVLGEPRLRAPGSRWMVPRQWARLGYTGYAAAFGFALGLGFATLVPSAGWYAVVAAAAGTAAWWQSVVVVLAFGMARAPMAALLTVRSTLRHAHPVAHMDGVVNMARRLAAVEAMLAAALGVQLLLHT